MVKRFFFIMDKGMGFVKKETGFKKENKMTTTDRESIEAALKTKGLKPIFNPGNHKCFGCSPKNPYGLKMTFFTDDESVFSRVTVPEHLCGWNNLVHGGVISTLLDEIMSWSAIYLFKKVILTKTMTVDFLKPVFIGERLQLEGRIHERTGEREAVMEGRLLNPSGEICARSEAVFALISPRLSRKMGILDEALLKDFEPLIGPI